MFYKPRAKLAKMALVGLPPVKSIIEKVSNWNQSKNYDFSNFFNFVFELNDKIWMSIREIYSPPGGGSSPERKPIITTFETVLFLVVT